MSTGPVAARSMETRTVVSHSFLWSLLTCVAQPSLNSVLRSFKNTSFSSWVPTLTRTQPARPGNELRSRTTTPRLRKRVQTPPGSVQRNRTKLASDSRTRSIPGLGSQTGRQVGSALDQLADSLLHERDLLQSLDGQLHDR